MTKQAGFTLIEVVLFIVITSILATTLLLTFSNTLQKSPSLIQNLIAVQTAKKCMEWLLGQNSLLGYSTIACPSSTVPSFCTSPTGYTLTVSVSCTTINSDASYKTIIVTVNGNTNSALTTLIANYD